MADHDLMRPTDLEVASLTVVGQHRPMTEIRPTTTSPLQALEAAVLPALRRPPCLVSFSGGMDSSFVLAVATRVARREGLPDPVPVTWRFTGAPRADESEWQERVLADLALDDWQVLCADDDLDLVGPVARRSLIRFGVLHPVNAHLHLPIIENAAGGSVLTGAGGDQILSGWRSPRRPSIGQRIRSHVPGPLVARIRQRRDDPHPWLRAAMSRRVYALHRDEVRSEPRSLDRRLAWHARRRDLVMSCSSLETMAAAHDVHLVNPLLDPGFLAALAGRYRKVTGPRRAQLLREVADGALTDTAIVERPKARFLEVFLREPTREFVRSWEGSGVDPAIVDADALRRAWSQWPVPAGTCGLVQQLWLTAQTRPTDAVAQEAR